MRIRTSESLRAAAPPPEDNHRLGNLCARVPGHVDRFLRSVAAQRGRRLSDEVRDAIEVWSLLAVLVDATESERADAASAAIDDLREILSEALGTSAPLVGLQAAAHRAAVA